MTHPPQTGDADVDETLKDFHDTAERSLDERVEAALAAQRRLQGRLTDSSPGQEAASMHRVAGTARPTP